MPESCFKHLFKSAVGAILATVVALALAGCASEPSYPQMNMISNDPDGDAAAFNASERHLSEVKWHVIQNKGPRPIWDRFGTKSNAEAGGAGEAGPAKGPAQNSRNQITDTRAEPAPVTREIVYMPPPTAP